MEKEMKEMVKVSLQITASTFYCHLISSKMAPGQSRLISLLPIITLFTFLPFHFSYVLPKLLSFLIISWLANFKLLLFAFDQPPLFYPNTHYSFFQFMSKILLPIRIDRNEKYSSSQTPKTIPFLVVWTAKLLLLLLAMAALERQLSETSVLLIYCCMAYLLVDVVLGVVTTLTHAVLRVGLELPSNNPYLSTSLQDFWGRRWNLIVTDILRYTVYKPLKSRFTTMFGEWAPAPAILITFWVSGIMHGLLYYHVTHECPTWEVICFFVLHGICVAAEVSIKWWLNGGWQLHWVVSGPLTVGFMVITAKWMFFPPVIRSGALDDLIQEFRMMTKFSTQILRV